MHACRENHLISRDRSGRGRPSGRAPLNDRQLEEALTHRLDPLHPAAVFGLDPKTAIRCAENARSLFTIRVEEQDLASSREPRGPEGAMEDEDSEAHREAPSVRVNSGVCAGLILVSGTGSSAKPLIWRAWGWQGPHPAAQPFRGARQPGA